ncbi:MAG: corrinoid protein [Candidatus Izimaplasma sp.]|nr:corrinoid protein [Candidatus Izimaplasma bacterium]
MTDFKPITQALVNGNQDQTLSLVEIALENGTSALDILNKGLIPGMDEVGRLWMSSDIFIPEVLVAARAMNLAGSRIEKELVDTGFKPIGTAIIGTVKGDLHDIGKNLVGMMLKGKGFNVIDLGVDVTKEDYLDATKKHNANFVLCSSLITTTMAYMEDIVQYFNDQAYHDKVKIACGGAPVTEVYTKKIGADIYADDAVTLANMLVDMMKE